MQLDPAHDGPVVGEAVPAVSPATARGWRWGMGAVLVLAVYMAGSPGVSSPWVQGDEFIFIVRNPLVNPAADPNAAAGPNEAAAGLGDRLGRIFSRIHDDLYQPVPIAAYAIEWWLTDGSVASVRRTDVLIHAGNGLLLWWVLVVLLRRVRPAGGASVETCAWMLALLWALHPVHVTTFAADMGRTHLLSAAFSLLALRWYVDGLEPRRWDAYAAGMACLILAMMCKAVPGWVLLALALEGWRWGCRRALLSPRVWGIAAICGFFAWLTMRTSQVAGYLDLGAMGLFGDPLTRSAVGVWLYFRNLLVPLWLTFWYLPDPRTDWRYWAVWLGILLALGSMVHAAWSWRRQDCRLAAVGWAWFWGLLLPVLGIVGAREVAAVDRYVYQPTMGLALVLGAVAVRWRQRLSSSTARVVLVAGGGLALACLLWDRPLVRLDRSNIQRAERLVGLNPGDPRALEALAAAYDFARGQALPPQDEARVPAGMSQRDYFQPLLQDTLKRAATAPNMSAFFPNDQDRGPFHSRLSYRLLLAGCPEESLEQAQIAYKLQPDRFMSWKRLAEAYRSLGRYEEAAKAYAECESRLPDDRLTRQVHFTDYGNLLLFDLERDAEGCPKYVAAVELGGTPPIAARIGLALCEIRFGRGEDGFRLISSVLEEQPYNTQAGMVLAEYHLRSHHWREAALVYGAIIRDYPTDYAALRGFHEVCLHTGQMSEAVTAWHDACQKAPERVEFRSYLVWALALADDSAAKAAAERLLEAEPDNPFACLAQMLVALRGGNPAAAIEWVERARKGRPIPHGREMERASSALRLLLGNGGVPEEGRLVLGAVLMGGGQDARSAAGEQVDRYLEAVGPEGRWRGLAEELLGRLREVPESP